MEGSNMDDWKTRVEGEIKSGAKWILEKGVSLVKKVVISGVVISSVPLLIPSAVILAGLAFTYSIPFGIVYASYVCIEKLMNKLLPMLPPPSAEPPMLDNYTVSEADQQGKEEEQHASESTTTSLDPSGTEEEEEVKETMENQRPEEEEEDATNNEQEQPGREELADVKIEGEIEEANKDNNDNVNKESKNGGEAIAEQEDHKDDAGGVAKTTVEKEEEKSSDVEGKDLKGPETQAGSGSDPSETREADTTSSEQPKANKAVS